MSRTGFRIMGLASLWLALTLLASAGRAADPPAADSQLEQVRNTIRELERRLDRIAAETSDVEAQRARLDAQLQLADARVREVEILLDRSAEEATKLREEASFLTAELEQQRRFLDRHLEIMAVLGRPGPLQLLFDAARGGELEDAVGTVAVLTRGQVRLLEQYRQLRLDHGARLAQLSRTLEQAQVESRQLEARRADLEKVQRVVTARLRRLEQTRRSTDRSLDDLREREAALQRLIGLLASQDRLTGRDDIRSYRGALPWPVSGRVVLGFGRHYLEKYATYTVCNGLRFDVASNSPATAIFPGVVAYARHFKGYGNMVVLDHGQDVYSLVAGLATIHVRVGQRVSMGTRLGLAAPSSADGNIYFELRVAQKAEDPRRWLQLKGGSS